MINFLKVVLIYGISFLRIIYKFVYYFLISFIRQQQLQFRPPFEEIKARYYRELRKFISIPQNFKGFGGDNALFAALIDRTASEFDNVFKKAEMLFERLEAVKEEFKDWVVLGYVNADKLADENLMNVVDWEKNFKMIKVKGREAEKMPS